ncbi:MAG: glycosyltransferase family 4 protein [Casimicrobiaceae bacterium]
MSLAATFFSVVPSPYQRDLFRALAERVELDLRVFYLEAAAPDSPWPERPLAKYEAVLPGRWFPLGHARCHVNWRLPDLRASDVVVCNTLLTSLTGQWLMRTGLRRQPWFFWGEKTSHRGGWRDWLSAPLHCATGIAAIGSAAERDYRERFSEPAHFNIPYHCDLDAFFAIPRKLPRDEPVFLYCGQMIARKGVDLLLAAFAQLKAGRLLLVGREAGLPPLLAALPAAVRERITYAGFQPPEALPQFFSQADVFILPSRYDGWGVVVNQALGAGLPILCSDRVGAGHDLVEDGVNGLRFPADDAEAMAAAMRRLLADPALMTRWGEASRRKARDWTPAVGAGKWIAALRATGVL